jgi:hypothetical protein
METKRQYVMFLLTFWSHVLTTYRMVDKTYEYVR